MAFNQKAILRQIFIEKNMKRIEKRNTLVRQK